MIAIKDRLPIDNAICEVQVAPYLREHPGPWRFVRASDGQYHWDNLADDILQGDEVTHWEPYNELGFLQYFYDNVRNCLGPASEDVYEMLAKDYEAQRK